MPFSDKHKPAAFKRGIPLLLLTLTTVCLTHPLHAEEKTPPIHRPILHKSAASNFNAPSVNLMGNLGLNTIPSARMDDVGTVRLGSSIDKPYMHNYIGFQILKPLYVNLRRTAKTSGLHASPLNVYPGVDIKLRLAEETATRPAIAIGLDSAAGHKRMASEYITLSKRFNNFDLTGGIAWGRLGSAGHIKNPLSKISKHFDKPRTYGALQQQSMEDWFTGEDVGFFGGGEYHTQLKGLSIKADYGANDYIGEQQAIAGFDAPAPWSFSLNYKPWELTNISVGTLGGEKIMANFSTQHKIYNWFGQSAQKTTATPLAYPRLQNKNGSSNSILSLSAYDLVGKQIGEAARKIANNTAAINETLSIALEHKGLKGPTVTLIRRDLENAVSHNNGSPEEIWHDTIISTKKNLSFKNTKHKKRSQFFRFIFDTDVSFTEIDTGTLYRNSLRAEGQKSLPLGFTIGGGARINLANNLHELKTYRPPVDTPIRSDVSNFANNKRFTLDTLYLSWLKNISDSTYVSLNAGYLEEMFAGYGGEVLYRPFGKTFAIGTEGWRVRKRDPFSSLHKKFSDKETFTGHLNLFYEVPKTNFTLYGKVGRYLKKDFGATLGLDTHFDNGATLKSFATVTKEKRANILNNSTYLYGKIQLSLPFGSIPFIPNGSEFRLNSAPIAQDTGQALSHPLPLYEVTEPISYRTLSHSWNSLLD